MPFYPVRHLRLNKMKADEKTLLGHVNGKFKFKQLPDGTVGRNTVICNLCSKEFSYHRSSSTLRYHLNAKHLVASSQHELPQRDGNVINLNLKMHRVFMKDMF